MHVQCTLFVTQMRWKKCLYPVHEILYTCIKLVEIYYLSINGLMSSQKFCEEMMVAYLVCEIENEDFL